MAVKVDLEKCTGCESCVDSSPSEALSMADEKVQVDVDACVDGTRPCVIVDGIEGWDEPSFTTFTEGQLPALLYLRREEARNIGYSIRECNLTAALLSTDICYRTVVAGIKNPKRTLYGVDSAD